MKYNRYFICLIGLLLLNSCKDDDDVVTQEPMQEEVVLTDNVEVYNAALVDNSLVLAVVNGGDKSYLVDKSGKKVKEWNFSSNLGNDLEIMPDGKLLGMFKTLTPSVNFGGFGGVIKIINLDGSIDWEYEYASSEYLAHHDVEMLPNGNILFLAWEKVDMLEAQQQGVNTASHLYPETLIEVNPNTNQIVWKWNSYNHKIQDQFPSLPNFGSVSSNPQLIDLNYFSLDNGDIMHANGIDYDAQKDVIYMSVNNYSEVWVIDHSTTILEAETSNGGAYNKGGDLIYRFGNPEAYKNLFGNRLFYNNHFPNLLEDNVPGEGNVLVFVNGSNTTQSTVYELDMPDVLNLIPNSNNEPQLIWDFTDPTLQYGRVSGAVRLQNGNTLICEGDYGFWEVTQTGEIAWKYSGLNTSQFWRCYAYKFDDSEILNQNIEFE
ncbi:aryl-sulfate sulfotransferase [Lacinutrix jangbogonensis]|uniref:aryl-sulfate sulfotransferase n=1 Tax=Lacinutrix jangbogonensis TaxID=1469557 RepID=UPI00053F0A5F|nr:aryl-sulfate sulfotransferase [Lacinutrix jangbogonensis]